MKLWEKNRTRIGVNTPSPSVIARAKNPYAQRVEANLKAKYHLTDSSSSKKEMFSLCLPHCKKYAILGKKKNRFLPYMSSHTLIP